MATNSTRTVIKHSFIRAGRDSKARAKAHVDYVAYRPGKEQEKESRQFFSSRGEHISPKEVKNKIDELQDRGTLIHKLIISPGVDGTDVKEFTRDVLKQVQRKKGLDLEYFAVVHDNTDHEHAHVIVFGKDSNGSPVRIYKKDYDFMRAQGDEITEPLMEKEIERERTQSLSKSILVNLARLGLPFRVQPEEPDKSKAKSQDRERTAFGEPPNKEKIARIKELNERRKKERQEKEITVYHCAMPTVYSSRTPKDELKQLIEEYEAGYYRDQIKHKDSMLIREWVNSWESWEKETAGLERSTGRAARRITRIEVAVGTDDIKTFSKDSKIPELQKLQELHEIGDVFLSPAEENAVQKWIGEKRRQEPVIVMLGQRIETCKPNDDIQKLENVAKQGKAVIPEEEYKRLWSWIFQKRMHLEIDQPINVKSPLGRLTYTRNDSRDMVEVLADKYRTREKWVVEQLSRKEYDRLCRWLSEKSDREDKEYPMPWL